MPRKAKSKKASPTKSRKTSNKRSTKGKPADKKRAAKAKRRQRLVKGPASPGSLVGYRQRGLGADSGGQSGDTQGLRGSPDVDSESVEELMEEGQSFEAEVLNGIERVPDPDEGEIETREVPEDDVPEEYQKPDRS